MFDPFCSTQYIYCRSLKGLVISSQIRWSYYTKIAYDYTINNLSFISFLHDLLPLPFVDFHCTMSRMEKLSLISHQRDFWSDYWLVKRFRNDDRVARHAMVYRIELSSRSLISTSSIILINFFFILPKRFQLKKCLVIENLYWNESVQVRIRLNFIKILQY